MQVYELHLSFVAFSPPYRHLPTPFLWAVCRIVTGKAYVRA